MTIASFTESLSKDKLPQTGSAYLDSLWYAGKGNWDKAHTLIQDVEDKTPPGFMHIFTGRKAITQTLIIGTVAPERRGPMLRWRKSGKKLLQRWFDLFHKSCVALFKCGRIFPGYFFE